MMPTTIFFPYIGEKSRNLPGRGADKMLQFYPTKRAEPLVSVDPLDIVATYKGKQVPKLNETNFVQSKLSKEMPCQLEAIIN